MIYQDGWVGELVVQAGHRLLVVDENRVAAISHPMLLKLPLARMSGSALDSVSRQ